MVIDPIDVVLNGHVEDPLLVFILVFEAEHFVKLSVYVRSPLLGFRLPEYVLHYSVV